MMNFSSLILSKLRVWIDVKLSEQDELEEYCAFHPESWLMGYYQALEDVKERL